MKLAGVLQESHSKMETHERILQQTNCIDGRSQQLAALNMIASTVSQSLDFHHTLNSAIELVPHLMGFEAGLIFLKDKSSGELTLNAYQGLSQELVNCVAKLKPGDQFIGSVVHTGEPLIGQILKSDGDLLSTHLRREGFRFFAAIPLKAKGDTLGVIVLASHGPRYVDPGGSQFLLSVGGVIGVAIENAVLYQDLAQLADQLKVQSEQLLAAMEHLAAIIAHELGNPLSVIITTLEYVRTQLDEKGEGPSEEIEVIVESVNTMHELLKNLSMLTGLKRPHFSLEKIDACLSQALALVAKQAEKHNVVIETAFGENLPPCQVDIRQLKQVFLNLVKNALEAMPVGGRLSVRVQAWPLESAQSVLIQISDTGVGIAEKELAHIFEPFYSTKPGGTGLGLPISQRIIERHEGSLSVRSQPGVGTTFTITLPSAKASE